MAKDLIEGGNKFLQKYQQSEKLVDVYNKAWIQKQVQDNDDFYFIQQDDFARWSKESHRRIEGHLYLLKIEDDDNELKTELVGLFPWLKAYFAASIGKEQIHDPDIIFFNNVIQSVYLIKLGRKSRFISQGPFNALGNPTITKDEFCALDLGGVVEYLESGLAETGAAFEELACSNLDDEESIEMLAEAIEDAQQPIRQFFQIWDLDTNDY